ncbi:IclR family transcriptional regulator domain-containing protein [Nocardiopsis nanhaiensis]
MGEPTGRGESMGGLAKGLAIIETFNAGRPRLTVSQAADHTGISPAAARRCLLTLVSLGYVSHDGKYFRPTPRLARLGAVFNLVSPLPTLAQPCLEEVRDKLSESASLAIMDGSDALFVARAEAESIVSIGGRIGSRLPAHGSSTGRVLLAELADGEIDAYLATIEPQRRTSRTLLSVESIKARILRARDEGVAFTQEELEEGVNTMAVPVRDSGGQVEGAMSVTSFAARTPVSVMRSEYLPVLQREAERLGSML